MKLSPNLFPWAVLMTNVVKHENCHILLPVLELNKCLKTKQAKQSQAQNQIDKEIHKEKFEKSHMLALSEKSRKLSPFSIEKKSFLFCLLFYLFTSLYLGIKIEFWGSDCWRRQKLDIPSY